MTFRMIDGYSSHWYIVIYVVFMMGEYYISRYMQILHDKSREKYVSQMEPWNTNGHAIKHYNFRDRYPNSWAKQSHEI